MLVQFGPAMEGLGIIFLLIIYMLFRLAYAYQGKVFDSTPDLKADPILTMETNLFDYLHQIDTNDDVVVLPEYGLTSLIVLSEDNLRQYGLKIPAVDVSINVCEQKKEFKIISGLSCAAREKGIYLVANIIEEEKGDYYNTNLVFNKQGALITKYRKINLSEDESRLKPGDQIITFETEFGTFGTFTSFDILNKRPALDILEQNSVIDILHPTSRHSKSPFWTSLSVQDGYAKRTGVNLLASAYNDPKESRGGAGIYQGRLEKRTLIQRISGAAALESEIGPLSIGRPNCSNMDTREMVADARGITNIDMAQSLVINNLKDNAKTLSHHSLPIETKYFNTTLYSSDKKLHCHFYAKTFNYFVDEDPTYKFVMYANNSEYVCGMVLCETNNITSCGKPILESRDIHFSLLRVEAIHNDLGPYDIPTTLRNNLKPVDSYTYCSVPGNVTVELGNQNSIVAFGVMFTSASNIHWVLFMLIIISIIITLL